jgi:hypothetical protein
MFKNVSLVVLLVTKKIFFLNLNYPIILRFENICLESNKLVWFTLKENKDC